MEIKIGQAVKYVDSKRQERDALITTVWDSQVRVMGIVQSAVCLNLNLKLEKFSKRSPA